MSSKLQQTNNTKERELFTKLTIKGGSPENYREENNQKSGSAQRGSRSVTSLNKTTFSQWESHLVSN